MGPGDGARSFSSLKGHAAAITALAFTPDGKSLVTTAGDDKTLRVWDCATGQEKLTIKDPGPSSAVPVLAVTPDGKQVGGLGGAGYAGVVRPEYGQSRPILVSVDDGLKRVSSLTFSADGSTAALGSVGRQGAAVGRVEEQAGAARRRLAGCTTARSWT